MSKRWPDKTIIGLTGSIASGKSLVRHMLEHHGAFGIDADSLAHRAMSPGAPAYDPILKLFGQFILTENGRIDRKRLGRIVFNDPDAMKMLESIIHPIVEQVITLLIKRAKQDVVVIEAIKLFETSIVEHCDSTWVVEAKDETRLKRLVEERKMPVEEARSRIKAQKEMTENFKAADTLIRNDGDFETTYLQVVEAFRKLKKGEKPIKAETKTAAEPGTIRIIRAGPKQASDIAAFFKDISDVDLSRNDILMKFGRRAYLLAYSDDKIIGLAGWQIENLITRVTELLLLPTAPGEQILKEMLESIERASSDLQSELSLLFIEERMAKNLEKKLNILDYERTNPGELKVPDWRDAIEESQPEGSVAFAKKLREDRVLRPM